MTEFELKMVTNIPAGSTGIISALPFPGWKEPKPITQKEMKEVIEAFKKDPEHFFKKDVPRWQ